MNDAQIKKLVTDGHRLQLAIDRLGDRLKAIKKSLIQEAASRPTEHEPIEGSDGTTWGGHGVRCEAVVTFPTDTLKESIKTDSKNYKQVEVLLKGHDIADFFESIAVARPIANFRSHLIGRVGEKTAERIIKLCTSESSPKVTWKETE